MTATDPSPLCDDSIGERAITIAVGELGMHEEGGNNRGPRVEDYLRSAGGQPGDAWCAAFLYWVLPRGGAGGRRREPYPGPSAPFACGRSQIQ